MQTILKHAKVIRKEWPKVRDLNPAGKKLWVVDARPHGRREGYPTEQDAMTRAEQLALEIENKGTEAIGFPTENRVMAAECALKPLRAALGGLPVMVASSEEKMMTLLDSMQVSARSRLNYRVAFSGFFNWAMCKKFIDFNPVAGISIKVKNGEVKILSVPQATALLKAAMASTECAHTVPFAAISLFAGLRPGEVEQLRWEQICFETNTIEVLAHTSKTRDSRFTPVDATLRAWLLPHRRKSGRIISASHQKVWRRVKKAAAKDEGIDFMHGNHDVLRHTYASYWLAVHKNRTELAEHMGNSVGVIKKHYRRPVLEQTAKTFWKLTPKALAKG